MNYHEARAIVLDEGIGPAGIVVALRMGEDPGPERMSRVVATMRVLFDELRGAEAIDRQLGYATFGLAYYAES
jgi:hypothetical protein